MVEDQIMAKPAKFDLKIPNNAVREILANLELHEMVGN